MIKLKTESEQFSRSSIRLWGAVALTFFLVLQTRQSTTLLQMVGCDGNNDFPSLATTVSTRPTVEPFVVDPSFQELHQQIDSVSPEERCAAFGVKPHTDRIPRRIFYGSLLANDNDELFDMLAIEAHNLLDVVAFVESNTTFMATPRTMRFRDTALADKLQYSNMFGNQTQVVIDYWLEDWPGLRDLDREAEQRDMIAKVWKEAGMTERDIGLIVDVDEIVSRDFLHALKVCDFPQLQVQVPSPSCQRPKLSMATTVFESTPFCISPRTWFHPDVILGQCVEGIGDPSERPNPLKLHRRQFGERSEKWGRDHPDEYPKHVLESKRFPLWSANDIRRVAGADGLTNYKDRPGDDETAKYGVAFHLHNWFDDLETLRHKYRTYGHPNFKAHKALLADLEDDMDMMVRCIQHVTDSRGREYFDHKNDLMNFWRSMEGPRPLYFKNETYIMERHKLLQQMVAQDEARYGARYNTTTTKK